MGANPFPASVAAAARSGKACLSFRIYFVDSNPSRQHFAQRKATESHALRHGVANAAGLKSRRSKAECLLFHYRFVALPFPRKAVACSQAKPFQVRAFNACSRFVLFAVCRLRRQFFLTLRLPFGQPLAQVASTACSPLWLQTAHRAVCLTRRALV